MEDPFDKLRRSSGQALPRQTLGKGDYEEQAQELLDTLLGMPTNGVPALGAEPISEAPTYREAGVDARAVPDDLASFFSSMRSTWGEGNVSIDLGHFASVVDIDGLGVAMSTDGVGTKTIIAQLMGRYDTIGIDCVAMNANDVICVGAKPVSMVDYIAVQQSDPVVMSEIGRGLAEGAKQAGVSIVGGETALLPEVIRGEAKGSGVDIAGTCIGKVPTNKIITGNAIEPGDAIVGLTSAGIHSNGLTLARRVLGLTEDQTWGEKSENLQTFFPELRATLGEELLRPTRIYAREVLEMLDNGLDIRGLAHITGDGLLNLPRLHADVGYVIEEWPEVPPIFDLIRTSCHDELPYAEMFEVFNMGIGFCVVVAVKDVEAVIEAAANHECPAMKIGYTVADHTRAVTVEPYGLRGRRGEGFVKY